MKSARFKVFCFHSLTVTFHFCILSLSHRFLIIFLWIPPRYIKGLIFTFLEYVSWATDFAQQFVPLDLIIIHFVWKFCIIIGQISAVIRESAQLIAWEGQYPRIEWCTIFSWFFSDLAWTLVLFQLASCFSLHYKRFCCSLIVENDLERVFQCLSHCIKKLSPGLRHFNSE